MNVTGNAETTKQDPLSQRSWVRQWSMVALLAAILGLGACLADPMPSPGFTGDTASADAGTEKLVDGGVESDAGSDAGVGEPVDGGADGGTGSTLDPCPSGTCQ